MANSSGKKGNSTYIGIKQIFNSVVLLGKNEKVFALKQERHRQVPMPIC